jgi:acetate kinase
MGTRCGQIDPGVLLYLMTSEGMSVEDLTELLFKRSGLAGLSGISHDMRVLQKSDRPEAARAIEYFVFRVRRELGAMAAVLGGVDALVFTGGVGENANQIRERICSGLEWLGIELDQHRNGMSASVVSSDRSRCRVFVIRTNEELVIASHTLSKLETESSRTAVAG